MVILKRNDIENQVKMSILLSLWKDIYRNEELRETNLLSRMEALDWSLQDLYDMLYKRTME